MSDTPRTNFVAHETGDPEWNRRFGQGANRFGRMMSHACILERELAAVENEMAVMYLALREAAALLSTTPKFSSETLDDIFEYLLNAGREKSNGHT